MSHKQAVRTYEPLGVVGVISPWNYPFILAMTPIITALFAGNSVVLKPSEVTPLVGRVIGDLFADVGGHPDLVQVVTGGGATGEALVRSGVDKICFTGSVRTGKRVMAAAADTLTPVLLELGGKDPMIVCADADLDRAAAGAVWGAFQNSGQTCMSVERVYVDEAVFEPFVDRVVARTQAIRQGVGSGHDIGSMTFPPQLDIVERHVADARDKGATVLTGGRPGRGARRPLVRADRAGRRRPLDGHHARRDVRSGAADHEGRVAPTRPCAWPTTRPTASTPRCGPPTPTRVGGWRPGSRPATCASTT